MSMNCSWFTSLLHSKVIKGDIFINKLKEPTEVPDKELKEIWTRERNIKKLLTIYNLTRSSNTAHNETQWQCGNHSSPLRLSRKILGRF